MFRNHRFSWQQGIILGSILAMLVLVLYFFSLSEVWQVLLRVNWGLMWLAMIPMFVGFLFNAQRFRYLLRWVPDFWPTFHCGNPAYLLNNLTPIIAPVTRVLLICRATPVGGAEATSVSVVEFPINLIMRSFAIILGLLVYSSGADADSTRSVIQNTIIVAVMLAAIFYVVYHPEQISRWLNKGLSYIPRLSQAQAENISSGLLKGLTGAGSPHNFMMAMLITLAEWFFYLLFQYMIVLALPQNFPVDQGLAIALTTLAFVPPAAPVMPIQYQVLLITPIALMGLAEGPMLFAYSIVGHMAQIIFFSALTLWSVRVLKIKLSDLIIEAKTAMSAK